MKYLIICFNIRLYQFNLKIINHKMKLQSVQRSINLPLKQNQSRKSGSVVSVKNQDSTQTIEEESSKQQQQNVEQAAYEYVNLGRRLIEKCKNKDCLKERDCLGHTNRVPKYHLHQTKQCTSHFACKMDFGGTMAELANTVAFPYPVWATAKGATLPAAAAEFQEYVETLVEKREAQRLDKKCQKVIVNQYALDNWRAQSQGLDIDHLPATRPLHLDRALWDEMKKRAREYNRNSIKIERNQNEGSDRNQNASAASIIGSDSEEQAQDPASRLQPRKFDPLKLQPENLKPFIYPLSRKIKSLVHQEHEQIYCIACQKEKQEKEKHGHQKCAEHHSGHKHVQGTLEKEAKKVIHTCIEKSGKAMNETEANDNCFGEATNKGSYKKKVHTGLGILEIQKEGNQSFRDGSGSGKQSQQSVPKAFNARRNQILCSKVRMKQVHQMRSNQQKGNDKEEGVTIEQKEVNLQGKAKFITVQRRTRSIEVRNNETSNIGQKSNEKTELSTFQKLQALRQKKPIHQIMQAAARQMPQNHFRDIERKQMHDYQQEQQNFKKTFLVYEKEQEQATNAGKIVTEDMDDFNEVLRNLTIKSNQNEDKEENQKQQNDKSVVFEEEEDGDRLNTMKENTLNMLTSRLVTVRDENDRSLENSSYVDSQNNNVTSLQTNKTVLTAHEEDDQFSQQNLYGTHNMSEDHKEAEETSISNLKIKEQPNSLNICAFPARKSEFGCFRTIDLANQNYSREYNPSILSPSINQKKTYVLKHISLNSQIRTRSTSISYTKLDKLGFTTKDTSDIEKERKSCAFSEIHAQNEVDQNKQLQSILNKFQLCGKPSQFARNRFMNRKFMSFNGSFAAGSEHQETKIQNYQFMNNTMTGPDFIQELAKRGPANATAQALAVRNHFNSSKASAVSSKRQKNNISFINIVDNQIPDQQHTAIKQISQTSQKQATAAFDTTNGGVSNKSTPASSRAPIIQTEDIETELDEPGAGELNKAYQQVGVILELQQPLQHKIAKNVFECAEYWFLRGYQAHTGKNDIQTFNQRGGPKANVAAKSLQQEQADQALDFYYQGLRKDLWHYGCCYNIGATFFQRGKNRNALKWFRFAKQLEPLAKEPHLGEAAACFKLGMLEESIEIIRTRPGQKQTNEKRKKLMQEFEDSTFTGTESRIPTERQGLKQSETDQKNAQTARTSCKSQDVDREVQLSIDIQFSFLKSICYKKSGKQEKAQKEYQKLEKFFNARLGEGYSKKVFMSIMLPMHTNRKVVEDYISEYNDILSYTDREAYWDARKHEPLGKILHFKTRQWADLEKAILWLRDMPLFSRLVKQAGFSSDEFRCMLPHLTVVEKKVGDLVFDEPGQIYIVLNGRVLLRYHEDDPLDYQNIALYTPGKVIGHDTLDTGISQMGQVFSIVISQRCLLLKTSQAYFDDHIWKRTLNTTMEVKIRHLQKFPFLAELSDQTLYNMMYEYGQIQLFRPAQLVLAQHPRSPLNVAERFIYDQEYGHHMKQEVVQTINNNKLTGEDQLPLKTNSFGSFFSMVNLKRKQRERQGITEDVYMNLHSKAKIYKAGNEPDSNMRSLCFVLEGSCHVINQADGFNVFELRPGNHFGASDLLRIVDTEFLGDIIAGERGAKILVIPKPDQVVQPYEKQILKAKLERSLDTLKYVISNRYQLGPGYLDKY